MTLKELLADHAKRMERIDRPGPVLDGILGFILGACLLGLVLVH